MIRHNRHEGTFYPRFMNQIKQQIDGWLVDAPKPNTNERCIGVILPHAGYVYSGRTAALGLNSIKHEAIESIIILHPSHHGNHFDFCLSPYTEYETPFGNLELDNQLYNTINPYANPNIPLDYHMEEHSLEIQLPMIRYFFPPAKICPILIGNQIMPVAERLADILYNIIYKANRRILILVSTDLSHYHTSEKAEQMDGLLMKYFMQMDADSLWEANQQGKVEACGIGGIMTLMKLAEKYTAPEPRLINYTHSGKTSGNNNQVVGYLAAKVVS